MTKEVNIKYFESLVKNIEALLKAVAEYKPTQDNSDLHGEANHLAGYIEVLEDLLAEGVDFEVKKYNE